MLALVLYILWLKFCASTHCDLLEWLIGVLMAPDVIIGVLGIIFYFVEPWCSLGAIIDFVVVAGLVVGAYYTARWVGCLRNSRGEIECRFP